MRKLTRRAFMRNVLCYLLANSVIRKLLVASDVIQICYEATFKEKQGTSVKAFLESAKLELVGRSEFADKSLNGHFVIDAINGQERWFWLMVDDYLFMEECVDHYSISPGQQLAILCM